MVKNIMIVFNFTLEALVPNVRLAKSKEKMPPGKKIAELKNTSGKKIFELLRKKGWRIKDVFYEIKEKEKGGRKYIVYRLKIILAREQIDDAHWLKEPRMKILLESDWEFCHVYYNKSADNITFNFYHLRIKIPTKVLSANARIFLLTKFEIFCNI